MQNRFYLLLLFVLALASCRKDTEEFTTTNVTYQPPVITVRGNLLGQVVSSDGTPIDGAQVWLGSQSTTTNEEGLFSFRNTNLNAGGTYVRVEQPGYLHGSTRFFPRPNADNIVRIALMPRTVAGSITATSGGTVTLNSGAKIELPANGVMDENGDLYTGTVDVVAQWLDPEATNLHDIMPGNLQGVNRDNQEVSMATFGMMAVELQSPDGRKLQVAEGKRAKLSFPLSAEYRAQAPASIPLWYFDEVLGLWVEEGQASLQGGMYVGEVSHFSFWNCDAPFPLVNITGTLNINGAGVAAGQLIIIRSEGLNASSSGYTDASGGFAGKVPKDEPLILEVWNGSCAYTASINIGPFSADTDLGAVSVTIDQGIMDLSGRLVDCAGEGIAEGAILIEWGENRTQLLTPDANGYFNSQVGYCLDGDFSIKGYDFVNSLVSEVETFTFSPSLETGDISVCDAPLTEYMIVDINGEAVSMVVSEMMVTEIDIDSTGMPVTYYGFRGLGTTSGNLTRSFTFWVTGLEEGTAYSAEGLWVNGSEVGMGLSTSYFCGIPCNTASVTLTEVGAPGEFITGTVSGEVQSWTTQQQISVPITASFRIIRTQ